MNCCSGNVCESKETHRIVRLALCEYLCTDQMECSQQGSASIALGCIWNRREPGGRE